MLPVQEKQAVRSYSSGDVDDFYRVALETGDEITLVVAEYQTADMELSLYNDADPENPVETILVTGSFASVTAPGSGTFFIRVNINSGASNYTLSVGTAIIGSGSVAAHASESSDLRLSDDFVPGQVIVRFKDEISIQSWGHDGSGPDPGKGPLAGIKGQNPDGAGTDG